MLAGDGNRLRFYYAALAIIVFFEVFRTAFDLWDVGFFNFPLKVMIGYGVLVATSLAAIIFLARIGNFLLAYLAILAVGACYLLNNVVYDATDISITNVAFLKLLLTERQSEVDLSPYFADVSRNTLWALGLVGLLSVLARRRPGSWRAAAGFFGCVGALTGMVVWTGAAYNRPLPFGLATPVSALMAARALKQSGPEQDASLAPVPVEATKFRNVVYIVDESVRGDYLGVNGFKRDTTPFLSRSSAITFGVAIAGSNCSYVAREMLRYGYPDRRMPQSVFAFAKAAGFRTHIIDAWKSASALWLSGNEAAAVEDHDSVDGWFAERDMLVAAKLKEKLSREGRNFVYVNKWGAHFPYHVNFPGASRVPANLRSVVNYAFKTDKLFRPYQSSNDDHAPEIADYEKSIAWNVDAFFAELSGVIDREDTIVVYTSDHGQSLWENGHKLTHCSVDRPHPAESFVPIIVFTAQPQWRSALSAQAAAGFSRYTHAAVLPTVLTALGVDQDWLRANANASLLEAPAAPRRFMIFNSAGTGAPEWMDVP
ncbi:MAG: sulfatase-like hydrolase/transferase [Beijerinckiaceae bacterium]|nr:sulfatase-like hydrolase/transferase [Beijerinckiaceae bacterium]